jgi:hypothetical protein
VKLATTIVFGIVASFAGPVFAQATVNVNLTPAGQQLAQEFGDSAAALIQKVQAEVNAVYETQHIGPLLDAFLTTTQFVNKSLGVDYQTQPAEIEIGVVVDGALSTDEAFSTSGKLTTGALVNIAAMAGLNLGHWGLPRLSVFANGFYESGSLKTLEGHLLTIGAHAQYKVLLPSAPGAVRWTGLDVTSGLEYARWTLGNSAPLVTKFTLDGTTPGESLNMTLTSTGTLSLIASTFSIPIEATTGVRFGDVFAVFAGGGIDLTFGSSTFTAALNGNMTETDNGTLEGTVNIMASGSQSPSVFTVHALAGLQLDVPHFHYYVEGLLAPGVYGAATGIRLSW